MRFLFILTISVFMNAGIAFADEKDLSLDLFNLLNIDQSHQVEIPFYLRVYYSKDNDKYQELQIQARNEDYQSQLDRAKRRENFENQNAVYQKHLDRIKGVEENRKAIYSTMDDIIKRNIAIRFLNAADRRIHPRVIDANDRGEYVAGFSGKDIIHLNDLDSEVLEILDSPKTYVELLVMLKTPTGMKLTEMTLAYNNGKFIVIPIQSHRSIVCPVMF